MSFELTPNTPQTSFGAIADAEAWAGAENLFAYVFKDRDGDRQNTSDHNEATAIYTANLAEANNDMAMAWLEWQSAAFVHLGYLTVAELQFLDATAKYGLVVKCYGPVSEGQTDPVPQQVATAIFEWERRLQLLRTGAVLKEYYAAEVEEDEVTSILELQEGLAPTATRVCRHADMEAEGRPTCTPTWWNGCE